MRGLPVKSGTKDPPTIFISYAWESDQFKHGVLDLADQLTLDGVEVVIDQYEQVPSVPWPQWMETNLRNADYVLLICSPAFYRRVTNQEKAGEGLGVQWEGKIIYNQIYNAPTDSASKFIPVLLSDCSVTDIPDPLKGHNRYAISTVGFDNPEYERLYRHITNQPLVIKPDRGSLVILPHRVSRRLDEGRNEPVGASGFLASEKQSVVLTNKQIASYVKAHRGSYLQKKAVKAYLQGLQFDRMHQSTLALDMYLEAIESDGSLAPAYYYASICFFEADDIESSREHARRYSKLSPHDVDAHLLLLFLDLKEVKETEEFCSIGDSLLKMSDDIPKHLYRLSLLADSSEGRLSGDYFRKKLIENYPDSAFAVNSKAETLFKEESFEEAIPRYEKAAELGLREEWLIKEWLICLDRTSKYDEGLALAQEEAERDPFYAFYPAAIAYFKVKMDPSAQVERYLRRALVLDPHFSEELSEWSWPDEFRSNPLYEKYLPKAE
jgi:tetratricopeptide (TPR) repeat protein